MASNAPVLLRCSKCDALRTLPSYHSERKYRCLEKDCGGDLFDPSEAKTVRADTPEEVSRAAADPRNVIGKHVLLRELGRGGMGAVYKAWDTKLRRWVAIKFLLLPGSKEDLQRFDREAQTAASLKHPNIASIYEIGDSEGKPYLAMEYIEGQSLHGLKLGIRRACEVVRVVALALDYAHKRSIIHRDLKPGNIILDKEDKPTILDFGLAKSLRDATKLTMSGMVVGTPGYMSPEQAEGRVAKIGPRSDLYQLGAVLYELITGRPPFRGESPAEILRRVVEEDVVPPSRLAEVPTDVETIILRCLEKEPARRYPSAKALADDLERFAQGHPIAARPPSTFTRAKKLILRHKAVAAAMGAVLMLAVVGLVYAAGRASTRDEHLRQGDLEYAKQQYGKALALYSRAEEIDRENAEIKKKLHQCKQKLKQVEDAGRAAVEARLRAEKAAAEEKARAALKDSARPAYERGQAELEESWKDLYRQGANLVRMRERLATAIAAFTESLGKWGDNPDALFSLGRARALRFELEEADRNFARAIELRPDFAGARAERAKLLMHRYIEAKLHLGWQWDEQVARPFAKWKDKARSVSTDQAWVAFADERFDDCLAECDRRLREKREQEELWKLRGDALYFSAGSFIEGNLPEIQDRILRSAIDAYTEAIRLRPNYYEARMMRGYMQRQRGQLPLAIEDIKVAHGLRPDDALACWFMAQSAGSPEKALEWYEKGLQVHPGSFICRMNRASALGQMGRLSEARSELEQSMGLNPAHYYPIYLRGAILSKTGDMEGAWQDFKKVTEMAPGFHSGWYNLGASSFNTRRWRDAILAMEQALKLGHTDRTVCEQVIRQARQKLAE